MSGYPPCQLRNLPSRSSHIRLLLPAPFHGRRDAHGFPILRNRASRNIDSVRGQEGHDSIIRQHFHPAFVVDHLPDAVADRFCGVGFRTVDSLNRGREKIFQLEDAARG